MKYILLLALVLAACGKTDDMPAMRAEAEGMIKNYQLRFDELNRRADSIMQRGNAIGVTSPDAANASRLFATSKGKLEQLRGDAGNAPGELAKIKDRLELQRAIDRHSQQFKSGFMQINADFDAVESWITLAENRSTQVSSRQPVVPPPPAAEHHGHEHAPPPGNPGQHGAGGTAPSPIR